MKNKSKSISPKKSKGKPVQQKFASPNRKLSNNDIDKGSLVIKLIPIENKKSSKNYNINSNKKKDNLFDLQQTLDINIEILKNYFKNTTSNMTLLNQDKEILDKLDKFITKYNNKKELINKINEIKSKNLIQLQIFYEVKRKLQETLNNCKESLYDNEDAVNYKDEYVKLLILKFEEVEIYLKRITAHMEDEKKKEYYQNYKMEEFSNLNIYLNKKKDILIEKLKNIKEETNKLELENKNIIEEEKNFISKEKKTEVKKEKEDKIIKKKNEFNEKKYKELIKNKVSKINLLKNFMYNNCNIDKLINDTNLRNKKENNTKDFRNSITSNNESKKNDDEDIKKVNLFKKKEVKMNKNIDRDHENNILNNINKEKYKNERSILPFDMTKRMSSFMDFSTVLNENSKINQNINRKNISKLWGDEISVIKKREDVYY